MAVRGAHASDGQAEVRDRAARELFVQLQGGQLLWRCKQAVKAELVRPRTGAAPASVAVAEAMRSGGLRAEIKTLAFEQFRRQRREQRPLNPLLCPGLLPPHSAAAKVTAPHLDAVEWARQRWASLARERLMELTRQVIGLDSLYSVVTVELQAHSDAAAGGLLGRAPWWGSLGELLAEPYAPQLRACARRGLPPALRRAVWAACLAVHAWECITDDVLRLDVADFCANNVCYFPFDEIVESICLAWSRDVAVAGDCDCGPPQPPVSADAEEGGGSWVPPCGVVPFSSFTCYACPFAFLADRLDMAYPLFRAFYCRHLSRLHTISCQSGTLLPICALFEHLVSVRAPQVLWLWDLIVGFDSPEIVAVLAAAILAFRARLLLSAQSAEDVSLVFCDLSGLEALPLIQAFLFPAELGGNPLEL
ncbi:unnamed protein product [Prorocentrum cordatum]|uniref:Rab-GAP TBC domain-containing protein n=1 Tax=Prorocentrum cordatum TaxID=2364126 RepID=A0ABN9RY55_9DINO|nr:unnamed protein product [Polarella glacialis]